MEDSAVSNMVVISIEQQYTGHAKRVAMAVKATGVVALTSKYIVIVDDDIDPSNISEVLWALGTRCDPETGIDIIRGCWNDRLDPMLSPEKRARGELSGSTALITACKPYHWIKDFPPAVKADPDVMRKTKQKWVKVST